MELVTVDDSAEIISAFKKIEKFLSCSYRKFNYILYVHFCVEGNSLCIISKMQP